MNYIHCSNHEELNAVKQRHKKDWCDDVALVHVCVYTYRYACVCERSVDFTSLLCFI